MAVSLQVLLL